MKRVVFSAWLLCAWLCLCLSNLTRVQAAPLSRHQSLHQHKSISNNPVNELTGSHIHHLGSKSAAPAGTVVMPNSVNRVIHHALRAYLLSGIFYGMLLIFGFYNLMMWFAMRQKHYLYYVLYNLSLCLYFLCTDGIAYQYLWPGAHQWNGYAYGVYLCCTTLFALLFTQNLLNTHSRAPRLHYSLQVCIILRTAWLFVCLVVNPQLFSYKFIEVIPFALAFYTSCRIWYKGYRPARFYVVGYSFLMLGCIIKAIYTFQPSWMSGVPDFYYSFRICFIIEMIFILLAIGDKVRLLKRQKELARKKIIKQLQHNEMLKNQLTRQLEQQVAERTHELMRANTQLQQQAEEISRMNTLLEQDNLTLQNNIEKVSHDRVLLADVDYEEFSRIYPDRETCFKFLADLKWNDGYICRRCSNVNYCSGHLPYSRRCTRCGYEESVIANTVLQNTRIPVNKAFYLIYLLYSSKGKISSHKLSEILSIRQSTCWAYSARIKKLMKERKKDLHNAGYKGWSKLVMLSLNDE